MKVDVTNSWAAYLIGGILLVFLLPLAAPFGLGDTLYFSVCVYSLLGIVWGVRLNHIADYRPWALLLAGRICYTIGELVQANTDASGVYGSTISSGDFIYIASHLLYILSLWTFITKKQRIFPTDGLLDGAMILVGLAVLGWQFLAIPTIYDAHISFGHPKFLRMYYPLLTYLELGMVFWLWVSTSSPNSGAFRLLALAFVFFSIAETTFYLTSFNLAVPSVSNLMVWLFAYVLWGSLAMHPSGWLLGKPREINHEENIRGRLLLLFISMLCLPAFVLLSNISKLQPEIFGIIAASLLIILLGWFRLRLLLIKLFRITTQLKRQAQTDYLTGMPNRRVFEKTVTALLAQPDSVVGLLVMDVDRFKHINDHFGYLSGDTLLKEIANVLTRFAGKEHLIARIGGDEFVVLIKNPVNDAAVVQQAWALQKYFDTPLSVGAVQLKISVSIGVVCTSQGEEIDFNQLFKQGESALRMAKVRQSQVASHTEIDRDSADSLWVINDFRFAIKHNQLITYFQPKVEVATGKVTGVEALVRWQHPERGLLLPSIFVPMIEATDLVHQLFSAVLQQSIMQWREWDKEGVVLTIAVNLSARDLLNSSLCDEIRRVLLQYNMPANMLELEITESSAISDLVSMKRTLNALAAMGVKLAIDDYGAGFNSLIYLQQLPFNFLKIDRGLVCLMQKDVVSEVIVRSTIELARNLKLRVVAEGVEDTNTYQQLKVLGCDYAQGYFTSPAIAGADVVRTIAHIEEELSLSAG